jgi:titin
VFAVPFFQPKYSFVSLVFCFSLVAVVKPVRAATFTVSNVDDSGTGSLRQAILDANANPGVDTIAFAIQGTGPFSITPLSALPPITDPVIIDGTSQPGYTAKPLVEINGSDISTNADGLLIEAGSSTVLGLAINRCTRDGIRIESLGTNVIQANFLGTDVTGTTALGNGEAGLLIDDSPENIIGGTTTSARNLISGGNPDGLVIMGVNASGNVVEGNFIGTSVTGTTALGNVYNGIEIAGSPGNTFGGTVAGAGNVVSGNGQSGLSFLETSASSNVVLGNLIGLNATGTAALGNGLDGVTLFGVVGNTVGGTAAGARNVLSGNAESGVFIWGPGCTSNTVLGNFIGTDITGKLAIPNLTNGVTIYNVVENTIGGIGPGAGNVISGNQQDGVLLYIFAANNYVEGNYIGVDATGTNALGNAWDGVTMESAWSNYIGVAGGGNVISGNGSNGILIAEAGAGTNIIQANFIGTDSTGLKPIPNAQAGLYIDAPGNTIGGMTASVRNLISGNAENGVFVVTTASTGNLMEGNYIGSDVTGKVAVPNGYSGIAISNAPANIIGGASAGAGNLISGNDNSAINLGGAPTAGTIIEGNYIGTDLTGNNALPNYGGIYLYGSPSNFIGGSSPGAGNLVSGNYYEGISIGDPGANYNIIQGNFVGTKADGASPLGNQLHNIDFLNTASWNQVGGSTPSGDNHIAYSRTADYDGIRNRPEEGDIGNFISRNSIFTNGDNSANGLGIKCSPLSVTKTNLPVLSSATSFGQTLVTGSIVSATGNTSAFLLQFYANVSRNLSGYGEGRTYLGSTNITTSALGVGNFSILFDADLSPGSYVCATATDANNSTWEFGPDVIVTTLTAPALGITRAARTNGAPITFSWSTNTPGFLLQSATNLNSPLTWSMPTNAVVVQGGSNTVTISPTGPHAFYRLIYE